MTDAPELILVPAEDFRATWRSIRPRLEELAIDHEETWIAEDVFHEILTGNASLWATADLDGFVVLQVLTTPHSRDLHVWIASNETLAKAPDFWQQLRDIGSKAECRRITFESPRRGFQRTMPHLRVRYLYLDDLVGEW